MRHIASICGWAALRRHTDIPIPLWAPDTMLSQARVAPSEEGPDVNRHHGFIRSPVPVRFDLDSQGVLSHGPYFVSSSNMSLSTGGVAGKQRRQQCIRAASRTDFFPLSFPSSALLPAS
jgi:uncharacterized protein (DUF1684 family)